MPRQSQTTRFDIDHPRPVFFVQEILPYEQWTGLTDQAAPNILPYYAISTYGRVWHIYENHFMRSSFDGPGYPIVVLRTLNGAKTFMIHRLVMKTFRYFPGCENMEVDHIDGIRDHNYIGFPNPNGGFTDNLEFVTPDENCKRSLEMRSKGFNTNSNRHDLKGVRYDFVKCKYVDENDFGYNSATKMNADKAKRICEYLQSGCYTYKEIAELTHSTVDIVSHIKRHQSWKEISKDYVFPDPLVE